MTDDEGSVPEGQGEGPVLFEYYGATEGGGTIVTPQEWRARPGTVGRPWPGSEVRVLDDDGSPCPPRRPGAIYMQLGANNFSYHHDAVKRAANRVDGFFTLGDVGYLDEDGYLFICDRKIDMIISGGVNIYPAEVEAVLLQHPYVADAAVFGIPGDDWGEQVKAVVQPVAGSPGSDALADDIALFCRDRLAKFKCLAAALPRDPSGKLHNRKLRDPYWVGRERSV